MQRSKTLVALGLLACSPLLLAQTASAKSRHHYRVAAVQTYGAPVIYQTAPAIDPNGNYASMISMHAAANGVPESLVRRVIKRESGGNARAVSKGNFGLMQIRLATARSMGYSGSASGLLDANTNMTYAVKYLAGAYRAAGGNEGRAVALYASGYYYAAKRQGLTTASYANNGWNSGWNAYGSANAAAVVPAGRPEVIF